jgi:hypothetical protein
MLTNFSLARYALGLTTSVAFLSGCSGPGASPPVATSATMPSAAHLTPLSKGRGSWMERVPAGTLLLYVGDGAEAVDIFTYPKGKHVGRVTGFVIPQGLCSDSEGNVYVADSFTGYAYEIEHGTSIISKSWYVGNSANGCSVSAHGDLAVTVGQGYGSSTPGWVTVFPGGGPSGTSYTGPGIALLPAGYDDSGNLFVEACMNASLGCTYPSIFELPAGGKSWIHVTLKGATVSYAAAIELMGPKTLGIGDQNGDGLGSFTPQVLGIYSAKLSGTTLTATRTTVNANNCDTSFGGREFIAQTWANESKNPNGLQTGKVTKVIAYNEYDADPCSEYMDTFAFPAGGNPVKYFEPEYRKNDVNPTGGQTLIQE